MSTLPTGWVDTRFEAIADIQLGKMLDKAKNVGLPTAYLRNINIRWGKVDTSDVLTMPMSDEDRLKFSIINGDVLVCEGGEPGRAAVWRAGPTDLKFQKAIMRVRAANGISPDWLAQYLRLAAQDGTLSERFTGTTIKHLPREALQATHLPVPPMAEQRRIVAKIDSLSAKSKRARDGIDHVPRLVARYKEAVLREALSGSLTTLWREQQQASAPVWRSLSDVAGDFSYGSAAKSSASGKCPVLRMGNIQDGQLDWSDLVYSSNEREIEKFSLRKGDVLFNRTNSPALVGKTALYQGEREAIYAGYLIRIRCQADLDPAFLTFSLNSPFGRSYCWTVKTDGVSQSNISAKKIAAFRLLIPSIGEQQEIVRRIEAAFAWIDRLAKEATSARALIDRLDQAILAKAFRGELVPQDPADEPASVLLERIRAERAGAPAAKRRGRPRAPALP